MTVEKLNEIRCDIAEEVFLFLYKQEKPNSRVGLKSIVEDAFDASDMFIARLMK